MKEKTQRASTNPTERRIYQRVPLDMDIGVSLLESEREEARSDGLSCRGRDISGGGISFYGTARYQSGNVLRLRIVLENNTDTATNALRVLGTVMWCKKQSDMDGFVTGVQFLNIYEDDFHSLTEYVHKTIQD